MMTRKDNGGRDQLYSSKKQLPACSNPDISNDEDPRLNKIGPNSKTPPFNKKFWTRVFRNFFRRFLRGYAGGVLLYSGVRIVAALLRNPFRKKVPGILPDLLSKDCIRLAAFCALYPSVYHLLVELFGVLQKRKNGWTYGISGGLAGLSIAVLDKSRRQTVSFFTLSRAFGAGLSTLVSRGHLPSIPFAEVALFNACTSIITYYMAVRPQYVGQDYYRSIRKWACDLTEQQQQLMFREPGTFFLTCQEAGIHQTSCLQHGLMNFLRSLPAFAKLYLPIHGIPVIVFKRKIFKERPLYVLTSLANNIVISTAFLGTMVSLTNFLVCILRNISQSPPPLPAYIPLVAGAIGSLALLIERKSRRKELSLFMIPQVLTVFQNVAKRSKLWPYLRLPHGFTITFALSMMIIMHAYEREPESLVVFVKEALKLFVGPEANTECNTL